MTECKTTVLSLTSRPWAIRKMLYIDLHSLRETLMYYYEYYWKTKKKKKQGLKSLLQICGYLRSLTRFSSKTSFKSGFS